MYTDVAKAKNDLQKILDSSPDVICTFNADRKFISVSAACKELWGYEPEELVGKDYLNFVFEEDKALSRQNFQSVRTADRNNCENRFRKKDGSLTNMSWTAHWDEESQLMYCVARCIDKKKQVADRLIESEKQLRFAQKLAKIGNWQINVITNELKWSDGVYEVYGLSREEYPAPTPELFFTLVHPDDTTATYDELARLAKADSSDFTHRLVRPDGKIIHVRHLGRTIKNEKAELIALAGTVQDITEQKEAEIRLALSEQRFKSLVQNGSDVIAILDEEGNFKYASDTTMRIGGYEPGELIGKNAFQLVHPDDVPGVLERLQEVLAFTNEGIPTPFRFKTKAGGWVWLEALGSNLMRETNIEGIVINARDITERKKLEQQLLLAQKNRQRAITAAVIKAQESERSQLGQELHDNVNQVLTTVKLYNEMLFDGIGDSKEILQRSIYHLQECINEIRSISKRLSAPTLGKISLEDSIAELVDSINLTKRLEISLHVTGLKNKVIPEDLHLTVYRIVQEQLNNIIKHAEAKHVFVQIEISDEELAVKIVDDGNGFDTSKKRKGIGITNMETRAENMHGKLEVISAPGEGCTLKAKFPFKGLKIEEPR